jgi:hypothetical protein
MYLVHTAYIHKVLYLTEVHTPYIGSVGGRGGDERAQGAGDGR